MYELFCMNWCLWIFVYELLFLNFCLGIGVYELFSMNCCIWNVVYELLSMNWKLWIVFYELFYMKCCVWIGVAWIVVYEMLSMNCSVLNFLCCWKVFMELNRCIKRSIHVNKIMDNEWCVVLTEISVWMLVDVETKKLWTCVNNFIDVEVVLLTLSWSHI